MEMRGLSATRVTRMSKANSTSPVPPCRRSARPSGSAASRRRDVPLAAEQAGGGVHADPAGAGHVGLGPGVQVGEIDARALRALDGIDVGLELDEVAGDEARREPAVAQQLHQQPGRVAARAGAQAQRLLRRLHARLHADRVGDRRLQPGVGVDQEVGRADRLLGQVRDEGLELLAERLGFEVGQQFGAQVGVVGEGEALGRRARRRSRTGCRRRARR